MTRIPTLLLVLTACVDTAPIEATDTEAETSDTDTDPTDDTEDTADSEHTDTGDTGHTEVSLEASWSWVGSAGGEGALWLGEVGEARYALQTEDGVTRLLTQPAPGEPWLEGVYDASMGWPLEDRLLGDADTVYWVTSAGALASSDGGMSWTALTLPFSLGWDVDTSTGDGSDFSLVDAVFHDGEHLGLRRHRLGAGRRHRRPGRHAVGRRRHLVRRARLPRRAVHRGLGHRHLELRRRHERHPWRGSATTTTACCSAPPMASIGSRRTGAGPTCPPVPPWCSRSRPRGTRSRW